MFVLLHNSCCGTPVGKIYKRFVILMKIIGQKLEFEIDMFERCLF